MSKLNAIASFCAKHWKADYTMVGGEGFDVIFSRDHDAISAAAITMLTKQYDELAFPISNVDAMLQLCGRLNLKAFLIVHWPDGSVGFCEINRPMLDRLERDDVRYVMASSLFRALPRGSAGAAGDSRGSAAD